MIPILILAAGQSSRMRGRDKLLEQIDGQPLLARLVGAAEATGHPIFVALPGADHPRYRALKPMEAICFDVPDSAEGIGGTMRGAVKRLPPCDAFMILLGDMPDIQTSDIAAILKARETEPDHLIWRGATDDGKPGHPILFASELRPNFAKLAGDDGGAPIVRPLLDQTKLVVLPGNRARLDLDTPEDWNAWRSKQAD